jgi:class 3 adenylate cyclase
MRRIARRAGTISAIVLVALVLASGGWAVWRAGRKALLREVERKLLITSAFAAGLISGDDLDRVRGPLDVVTPEFWKVQAALARVRALSRDARYVYTMRWTGHGRSWSYVVDVDAWMKDEDGDGVVTADELPVLPGQLYEALPRDQWFLALAQRGAAANMEFVEDPPWGVLASVYAPILRRDGTVAGLLGIDVEQDTVVAKLTALKWSILAAFTALGGLLALTVLLLARVRRMYAAAVDLQRQLIHVKVQLAKFVPASVLQRIEANPDAPDLDKKPVDVTVLFLDVESYTRLSEILPADRLRHLVESYFSRFLDLIRANDGDVNETAGDGLMVIYQAEDHRAHALHAVLTAAAVQVETEALNRQFRDRHEPVRINIGIASGTAEVGSSRFSGTSGERWTFTATGSVTNLAARLSGLAKHGEVLLAPETAARVNGHVKLEDRGRQRLKNVSEPVQIFRLMA